MLAVEDTLHIAYGTSWRGGNYPIVSVDIETSTPQTGPTVPTEGFHVIRRVGGAIYLTWVDPTGAHNARQGYSYSEDNGLNWSTKRIAPAYHFYDLREFGGDLFICGSGQDASGVATGVVWRSRDSGITWEDSLRIHGGGLVRIHNLVIAGSTIYTTPSQGSEPGTWRFDGDGWTLIPELDLGSDPRWTVSALNVAYSQSGWAFDGERKVDYSESVYPSWADSTHVYAVNRTTGHIDRAPLLKPEDTEVIWSPWLDLGEGMTGYVATTATLHDGFVYVGGTQGRIWRLPAP